MAGGVVEEEIRRQVRALRDRRGWTQKDFAKRLKDALPLDRKTWARQANVSKYESGAMDADIDTLLAIARTFKVPLVSLVPAIAEPAVPTLTADDHELLALAPVGPTRDRVLKFLDLSDVLQEAVIQHRTTRQRPQSGPVSSPGPQAVGDGTPRRRGPGKPGGGGKRR